MKNIIPSQNINEKNNSKLLHFTFIYQQCKYA